MIKSRKEKKLSHEILGLMLLSFLLSLLLLQFLSLGIIHIVDSVIETQGMVLTDAQLMRLDDWIFQISLLASIGFFVILFLSLLGERLSYIQEIIRGIHALREGRSEHTMPLERNNELTRLAEAVNYLSAAQREIREKERVFNEEKETLIRTLSHDIRTPLTSILAYSEYLIDNMDCSLEERQEQLFLIRKKGQQIKGLTDILLGEGVRSLEYFENGRLLIEQLAAEFEEMLEDGFSVSADLTECIPFPCTFDVRELRRIFDNLASNIRKYADPLQPVGLFIGSKGKELVIRQRNGMRTKQEGAESYQMGLNSIRRIAQHYGGRVEIQKDRTIFEITITFSDF